MKKFFNWFKKQDIFYLVGIGAILLSGIFALLTLNDGEVRIETSYVSYGVTACSYQRQGAYVLFEDSKGELWVYKDENNNYPIGNEYILLIDDNATLDLNDDEIVKIYNAKS